MRYLKTALVLVGLLTAVSGPRAQGDRALDDMVNGYIKRHGVPSAAVAVVRDGRIVKAAGYGTANLELGVPASEHTVYEIGSISKQFAAEAAMMLAEEGRLSLDDPIAKYVPGIPAEWSAIRIRHVLSHTSGLHDWEAAGTLSYRREYTPQEYIDVVARYPLDFAPGTRWAYTNSSFPLLGLVIQRVSGRPFEQFVVDRIFRPAGMSDTRFKHAEQVVPRRSGGYVDHDGTLENGEHLRPGIIAPNGGIMSTAIDMAKWQVALGDGTLLKRETRERMWTPIQFDDGRTFNNEGLSWFIQSFRGHRHVLHNGSTIAGYSSVVYRYLDDGMAVVVLMNVDRWNVVNVLATRVANFYVPGLDVSAIPEAVDPDPVLSRRFSEMLGAIGAGRDSDLLADSVRVAGKAPRIPASFGYQGDPKRFVFLEREDLGQGGQERFGAIVRWLYRYKLVLGDGVTYYTLQVAPDGKVSGVTPEKE